MATWRWQGGTDCRDQLRGASMGPDGSFILAGYTFGDWNGGNAGSRDWTAVKLDEDGTLLWKWQNGTAVREEVNAVAVGVDGSVVMVGNAGEGTQDFSAVKLDKDGGFLWEVQDGSSAGDAANAVAMTGDGSVVWAGTTFGLWGDTFAGSSDFTASKYNAEGTWMWTWQNGTHEEDETFALVVGGDDDSVVLAGHTSGNWAKAHGGDGDADFAAVKLDADGHELWRWQDGTTGDDMLYGAADGQNGSTVLAGLTAASWNGTHAGGINDFAAVKLDVDGVEIWRWQDGTTGDDVIKAVAPGDDGSVVLAGYTKGAWSGPSDGSNDFAAVKLDASGVEVWRWQGGSSPSASDCAEAVAAGPDGSVVLAGWTGGDWTEENAGVDDFAAVMLDTADATSATASPSPGLPSSGAQSSVEPLSPIPTSTVPDSMRTPAPGPPSFSPAAPAVSPSPVRTSRAPALPVSASTAPPISSGLSPVRTVTPGPAPLTVAPTVAAPASSASPVSTSGSSSVSTTTIGMVCVAVTMTVVIAAWCVRRRHRNALQRNNDDKQDDEQGISSTAVIALPDDGQEGSTSGAPPLLLSENDPPPPPPPPPAPPESTCGGCDVAQAVLEIALDQARQSQFPGVSEAAALVSTLVDLISNDRGNTAELESRLKRCRLLVTMLQRAATVLGKIDIIEHNDASSAMKRTLIENVQDAIGDMVALIKTYRSMKRITQVVVSTLFKRRMEETDAVIDQTFADLMRWLHIDSALNMEEARPNQVGEDRRKPSGGRRRRKSSNKDSAAVGPPPPKQTTELRAESIAAARRLRRQRNLDQIEIPEDQVVISEDVLGKGGFGTVYLADYNGQNAAAKVIEIDGDHDARVGQGDDVDSIRDTERGQRATAHNRQRESFLLELQAMIRLRSPYTVNVYGAITSRKDRIVLLMELLTGGDLCLLLRHSEERRLPEVQARSIIGDVCAGMAYLHSKDTIHGDLKSANVLLDGEGRAKIGDFGTSRWVRRRDSTGLATYRATRDNTANMMSFAWAAPEVLEVKGSSYASDVYSFGIVAWEVLSMQVPWADEASPLDIYKRVVFRGERPEIPADIPADIAPIVRDCWAGAPEKRPTASEVLGRLKSRDLLNV